MKKCILLICCGLFYIHSFGQSAFQITGEAENPLYPVQPTMWGLFFEDINFAADEGLYAELVKNRSLEFPDPLEGWKVEGANFLFSPPRIVNRYKENADNPCMARIPVSDTVCIINHGFRGMGLKENEPYRFFILSSVVSGHLDITIMLIDEQGREIEKIQLHPEGQKWFNYESVLESGKKDARGGLKLCFKGEGIIESIWSPSYPNTPVRIEPMAYGQTCCKSCLPKREQHDSGPLFFDDPESKTELTHHKTNNYENQQKKLFPNTWCRNSRIGYSLHHATCRMRTSKRIAS